MVSMDVISSQLKPVSYITITDVTEKVEKNRRYAREREYLRDCAARDSMTRLLNRGTMEDRIKEELESVAEGQNYAYIAIDLLYRLRRQKEMIGMAEEPTASIGIAFGPEDGTSFRELYHRADAALYQVKKEEKNSIAIYTMI